MNIQKIIFIRRVIEEAEILFQFLSQLRNYTNCYTTLYASRFGSFFRLVYATSTTLLVSKRRKKRMVRGRVIIGEQQRCFATMPIRNDDGA